MHTPHGPGPAWWVSKLRDQVWTPSTQVKSWVLQHTCDQHWGDGDGWGLLQLSDRPCLKATVRL